MAKSRLELLEDSLTPPPPKNETEIIASWGDTKKSIVSICMLTYNHEAFIKKALDGILNQRTTFGFEVLIHDDASSDKSQAIIKEYEKKYPNIIKPIYQTTNQYSNGINPTLKFNYPRAHSDFIAMCEGDDCWTDESKLQRQVDSLLKNPEVDFSFHQAMMIDYLKPEHPSTLMGDYSTSDEILPFITILLRTKGALPTASSVIRRRAILNLIKFIGPREYLTIGDVYQQIFGAMRGGALFIAKPMSIYRRHTSHSWSLGISVDPEKKSEHEVAMILSFCELEKISNKIYSPEFKKLIIQRLFWLFDNNRVPADIIKKYSLKKLQDVFYSLQQQSLKQVKNITNSKKNNKYVIHGAGSGCALIMRLMKSEDIVAIIDIYGEMIGETMYGIPIDSEKNLHKYNKHKIIISRYSTDDALFQHIIEEHGFKPTQLVRFYQGMIDAIDIDKLLEITKNSIELYKKNRTSLRISQYQKPDKATNKSGKSKYLQNKKFISEFSASRQPEKTRWTKENDISCDWILQRIKPGNIIDVGCTKYLIKKIQDRNDCDVSGFYVSNPPVDRCIKKYQIAEILEFCEYHTEHSIDSILAHNSIQHSPNPLYQLWQFNRALRDEGVLIITVPQHSNENIWKGSNISCLPPENWLMLFTRAGFSIRESETVILSQNNLYSTEHRFVLTVMQRGLNFHQLLPN